MTSSEHLRFGPVRPEKVDELTKRLGDLGVRELDLDEQFVRARGPGGQKVNKTSSAVQLRHLPSGIEVKAQQGRSQALNRFYARRMLADKLEAMRRGTPQADEVKRDKARRGKQRRARRARQRLAGTPSERDPVATSARLPEK